MISRPTNIYACNGRERVTKPHFAQDGYHEWEHNGVKVRGAPKWIEITTEFKEGCKYDKADSDVKCNGCAHKLWPSYG